ncbi:7-deoxyloganetin glucosyltransferase-like [Lolium rigidum]|uniref:7-deoxyloganetin glucosyltransferase-like n=1 Tax=Lolium rigidum TaxID=89674 RepID=UPI001F5CCFB8|nr:7-deoxyloganetin glucosyltransferase-like [Lolium rigidum]
MGSASMGGEEKPHAVCLPYPAQGHITPMLNVAKLLHARGFHVTFVNSEYNHARLVRTRGAAALAGVPGFRFATIPDCMLAIDDDDDDITQDIPTLCKSTTETCLEPFRRLLAEINASASAEVEGHPLVTCVISDIIMGLSLDAAKELGLPYIQLWTASAVSYLVYHHYRLLIDRGIFPLKDVKQLMDGYLNTLVEDVPGLRSMRLRDFLSFICSTDPEEFMVGYAIKETERTVSASAMVINSFANLEGQEVDTMETLLGLPKVYTLGPCGDPSYHCMV